MAYTVNPMPTDAELQVLIARYRRYPDFAELDLTDINQPCYPDDDTLLHLVSRVGGVDEIALLVTSGADVNARGEMGYTPLHWAALRGRLDVVEKLLGLGADLSLRNEFGSTPFADAQREGHPEIVRLLTRAQKIRRLGVRASPKP